MNWNNITKDKKVKELLIKRIYIEQEIKRLDESALINYELEALTIPVVSKSFFCSQQDVMKHNRCIKQCESCKDKQ